MTDGSAQAAPKRIGRPPKVDEHGTPTLERLLNAAIEACVEFGYEAVTLSEIARRAEVSTPAVYSHFASKADLLVAASKRELDTISGTRLPDNLGLRSIARRWISDEFADTRILIGELHRAAGRHPEVAELLDEWLNENAERFQAAAGLSLSQIKMFYLLLLGFTNLDSVSAPEVSASAIQAEMTILLERWLAERYR